VPALNRARALNNAAMARYGMGDRVRALEQWEEALLLFERIDARIEWVRVSNNLCLGYVELGRWERSRQAGLQAWEGARELGVAELEASSASNLSELALCEGRWDECLTWIERSRTVAERIGMQEELAELLHRVAVVSAMREAPEAKERAREAEVFARGLGLIELAARSLALRGLACAQAGDRDGMRLCLSQSLSELRQAQAECGVHQVRLITARAAYRLGEFREAVADCDRVALYAREKGLIALRDQAESLHQLARQRIPASDQEARLDCLLRLAVAVARERDRDTLLDTIAAAGLELLDGQRSYVVLQQEGQPRVVAARYASPAHRGDPSMTILRKCLGGGGEIIAPDLDERQMSQTSSLLVMNVRWVMCVPMGDRGAVVGAIYVDSCNVTQQVLNESLRFMRALAAHAATAYGNYRYLEELGRRAEQARDVAHDLRAPVAGIMSLASELRQPMSNLEQRYQLIDTIQLLAQRAMTLAEGYLRDRSSQPIDMDLQPLIVSHCQGLHRLARDHGIELVSRCGAPLVVNADPDDLGRALGNLVTNSIKFSPPGTTIRVVAEEYEGQALISVRDQGPGIPADLLHHLFERGRAGQGPGSGHGLGLSIVRRLVEANRGRVHAFNLAMGGAEFQIVLPLRAAAVEDMAAR
jgi:signal transduction histidine kinase